VQQTGWSCSAGQTWNGSWSEERFWRGGWCATALAWVVTSRPLYENEMRLSEVMTLARSGSDVTADNVCYLN